jgi:hypothetical protein
MSFSFYTREGNVSKNKTETNIGLLKMLTKIVNLGARIAQWYSAELRAVF